MTKNQRLRGLLRGLLRYRMVRRAADPLLRRIVIDPRYPFSFVGSATRREIERTLRGYQQKLQLLRIPMVRQMIARDRMNALMSRGMLRRSQDVTGGVAHNTVDYNIDGAISAPDLDRPSIMFDLAKGIERINKNVGNLDVLTIGPRSEIEIFAMMAAGFDPARIKALDLFSYSPYVDLGDMHKTPYADNSFDVIFLGWVLSYSKDQASVARELTRIARDRCVIVLAGDYSDDTRDHPTFKNETTHMQSCDQLLALFGDSAGKVYFRHDPELPDVRMVMVIFEIEKKARGA